MMVLIIIFFIITVILESLVSNLIDNFIPFFIPCFIVIFASLKINRDHFYKTLIVVGIIWSYVYKPGYFKCFIILFLWLFSKPYT